MKDQYFGDVNDYVKYGLLRALSSEAALRVGVGRVLARRSLPLSPVTSARIDACSDSATLERWLDDAVVAASADDVVR